MGNNNAKTITRLLEDLADAEEALADVTAGYTEARNALIPPEVQQALADLDNAYGDRWQAARERVEKIDAKVREAVRQHGATVKGTRKMAVFSIRTSWDTPSLNGYAVAHPEVLTFRSQTPTVSIRKVENGNGGGS